MTGDDLSAKLYLITCEVTRLLHLAGAGSDLAEDEREQGFQALFESIELGLRGTVEALKELDVKQG